MIAPASDRVHTYSIDLALSKVAGIELQCLSLRAFVAIEASSWLPGSVLKDFLINAFDADDGWSGFFRRESDLRIAAAYNQVFIRAHFQEHRSDPGSCSGRASCPGHIDRVVADR